MTDFLVDLFRFLHFIGLAALLGGLIVNVRDSEKRMNSYVLYGAYAQLATGIVLLVLTMADANHLKVTVKLGILLIILLIAIIKRKGALPTPHFYALVGLTLTNIGLAVFW